MGAPRISRRAFTTAAALGWLAGASPAAAAPVCSGAAGRILAPDSQGRRLSVADAATLQVLGRHELAQPLCAEPAFSPDGRFAFFCTTGGELFKYDLHRLVLAAMVPAQAEVRDMAVSADGKWVLLAAASPHNVLLFDAQLNLARTYPPSSLDGTASSPVASVRDAGPRRCFIVGFEMLRELWEISYDPAAEPIFDGLVHDYRMAEALATRGYLGVRRVPLDQPMAVAGFDESHRHVLGPARTPTGLAPVLEVVNLDVRRRIAQVPVRVAAARHQAAAFSARGGQLVAVADAAKPGTLQFIATQDWRIAQALQIGGDELSIASHPRTPHLWVVAGSQGKEGATLTLIDKQTLQQLAAAQLPGSWPARVAFSCDGLRAIVSAAGPGGAIAGFDAQTGAALGRWS